MHSLWVGSACICQSTETLADLAVVDCVALEVLLVAVDVRPRRVAPATEFELCRDRQHGLQQSGDIFLIR